MARDHWKFALLVLVFAYLERREGAERSTVRVAE